MVTSFDSDYALTLVNEALLSATILTGAYRHEILSALERVKSLFQVRSPDRKSLPLIVSAATRNLREAEQQIVTQLLGDHPDSYRDISALVEARTLCAKLLAMLTDLRPARRA
jgi:hypothetical protein